MSYSEECSAVAFYGLVTSDDSLVRFYERLREWFMDMRIGVDLLGVRGVGHAGRPVSFEHASASLQSAGFHAVDDLTMFSLLPHAKIPVDDFVALATISRVDQYALWTIRSSLVSLSRDEMLPLVRKVAEAVRPAYGIGYRRAHRFGPAMFAIGITQGLGLGLMGDAFEEARAISRWGDMGMVRRVWENGVLRGVYPWNFLSPLQLAAKIEGQSLRTWIERDSAHGTLEPLTEGIWLWETPDDCIATVRNALQAAGRIFDWRKYA